MEDVEGLRRYGVDRESFDCALSCQVLCSVPNPRVVAGAVWRLLKPGGEMIVYEHVRSRDFLTKGVQSESPLCAFFPLDLPPLLLLFLPPRSFFFVGIDGGVLTHFFLLQQISTNSSGPTPSQAAA